MTTMKQCNKNWWLQVAVTLLLVALTYPLFEPDYVTGLDSSYVWGLNYLFDSDYTTLTHLIYPYGPLALLKLPTPYNGHFAIFLIFYTLVKAAFIFLTLEMARRHKASLLFASLLAIPMCMIGNLDSYIVGGVALLVFDTIENNRFWPFAAATLVSALALTIKLNIGLQCCSVLFIGWLVYIFVNRNLLKFMEMALSVPVALLIVGLVVFQSFNAMTGFAVGAVNLLGGYSEALVIEPNHRLWALIVFTLTLAIYPILQHGKWSRLLYLMLLIPLIANWKHGIVREDYTHFKNLTSFASVMLTLLPLAQDEFRWKPLAASVLAMAMLAVNIGSLGTIRLTAVAPKNVVANFIHYRSNVENSKKIIDNAYASRQLPASTIATIGGGTVDCYPWEHIYLAANNLRWQPHATVELGAGNSLWLNHKAAENFRGDSAVNFIILHPVDPANPNNGLRSLDGRYLLNDEPEIISTILANYAPVDSGYFGLLLRRRETPMKIETENLEQLTINQGEWTALPDYWKDGVLKVAVKGSANLKGRLRSMIYKPDVSTIDYLMSDSTIHTYRYSPATAEGGLWVSPLLFDLSDVAGFMTSCESAEKPIAIRLNYNHPSCHKAEIKLKFWVERRK